MTRTEETSQPNGSETEIRPLSKAADCSNTPRLGEVISDLIDFMDIAMWELDREYRVVSCNQKARDIYGENAIGRFCYTLAAKRDSPCPHCPAKMVFDGHKSGRSEHARTDVQGRPIFIDHMATPIKNTDGEISGALVLIIDITQHKRMEEELKQHRDRLEEMVAERTGELQESQNRYRELYENSRRAEEVYRSLLNSSADAVVIYDMQGSVKYISPVFTRLFGWSLEELEGKRIPYVPESYQDASLEHIRNVVEKGEPLHGFETKRYTKDGRLIDVSISGSRFEDHRGEPAGMLVTLRDITESKKLQEQFQFVQRMEAIATLAGGLAHDFNNLLMGIIGNISLLMDGMDESHPYYAQMKNIESLVESGARLTKQLLGYARKGPIEIRPVDLNRVVQDVAETFGRTRKDISVHLDLCQEPVATEVDRHQIEQVLLNLCINAADAMPRGGELTLSTRTAPGNALHGGPSVSYTGDYVRLEVTDTGVGMDPEILNRIFDPFFTTKGMGQGTGLGLASVYAIINAHGGFVRVSSEKGKGSTFQIYLRSSAQVTEKVEPEVTKLHRGTGTILVVDDEAVVLEAGAEMIRRMGYEVLQANSSRTAVEQMEHHRDRIDLVLLDLIMPGENGEVTYTKLKKIKPELKVLISSGYSLESKTTRQVRQECNGFIQKPYTMQMLSKKLEEILSPKEEDPAP